MHRHGEGNSVVVCESIEGRRVVLSSVETGTSSGIGGMSAAGRGTGGPSSAGGGDSIGEGVITTGRRGCRPTSAFSPSLPSRFSSAAAAANLLRDKNHHRCNNSKHFYALERKVFTDFLLKCCKGTRRKLIMKFLHNFVILKMEIY